MTVSGTNFNTSSADAKTFAPCSCAAETMNNSVFTGIALAMSVLLCLVLTVNVLSIYGIITGIIILNIILGSKYEKAKILS